MQNILILLVTIAAAGILVYPRIAKSVTWRATITPLASIIGSGFLVLGPILNVSYGVLAPLVMALLCGGAWMFGSAIRFNIARLGPDGRKRSHLEERLEVVASWVLAFAYFISVAYYLTLFGAFGVSLTPLDDALHARLLTSAMLLLILMAGWLRGFHALERMEQVSVGIKLSIIAGLLFGLGSYFFQQANNGELVINPPMLSGWANVTLAFGLIVTVQGFETSRYLGADYSPETRIRSMRVAQSVSTVIYLIYICLLSFLFQPGTLDLDETAIIDMVEIVAPILPVLLVAAALSAQFSSAVADTGGSGGLITELTHNRVASKHAYAILVAVGLVLTWSADVFQIISYASRAFALYYGLQALIAAVAAHKNGAEPWRAPVYMGMAALGGAIMLFGAGIE